MTPTRIENTLAMMDAMCDRADELPPGTSKIPIHAYGCVEMADALTTGRCGLPRDAVRAKRYLDRACSMSYAPACNALH